MLSVQKLAFQKSLTRSHAQDTSNASTEFQLKDDVVPDFTFLVLEDNAFVGLNRIAF